MPSSVDMTSGADGTRDTTPSLPRKPAFKATRLTFSTFVIKEYADSYDEHPLIYAKICSEIATIVIIDTGCGGTTKDPDIDLKSLRQFVETVPVEENDGEPLNKGSEMRYVVVLSHCHYDHILGVEEFSKDSQILASGYSPTFLDPDTLPTHSLCKFLDIPVPSYKPILVPHDYPIRMNNDHNGGGLNPWTGLRVLHTPGHTPDELAVWDAGEHMLYVGDTLYEWEPIIFPAEGSITAWLKSVDELLQLINDEEAGGVKKVKISCGHVTAGQSAREVITGAKAFIVDVLEEKQPVRRRSEKRGEAFVEYAQEGHRFSLACPERLIQEARQTLSQL